MRGRPKARLGTRWVWFAAILAATCLEGLGRKFLPFVPSTVFYFLKDGVLVAGLLWLGINRDARRAFSRAMGPFAVVGVAAFAWTVIECVNPSVRMVSLGLVGLRAYWLWWLMPPLMLTYVRTERDLRGVAVLLGLLTLLVAVFAAYQYSRPTDDAANIYALYEGEETNAVDTVASTGRVRVSSTFSYLTGFVNFILLVPPLLLALGVGMARGRARLLTLAAVAAATMTAPMSGSRSALVLPVAAVLSVLWGAGLLSTRAGRRMLGGVVVAAVLAATFSQEAIAGVMSRFEGGNTGETNSRFLEALNILPPVALANYSYDPLGSGTGTASNAAITLGVSAPYYVEAEYQRVLVEQGVVGYLLIWMTRLGLAMALFRCSRRLNRLGQGALSGAALAYAGITMFGSFYADHVFNALFFLCAGVVLAAARLAEPTSSPPGRGPERPVAVPRVPLRPVPPVRRGLR